jgi:hypothetical protein
MVRKGTDYMGRATLSVAVLVALGLAARSDAQAADPVMAQGEDLTVTRGDVLTRLNTRLAGSVLEEMVLDVLVAQKAADLGIAPPSRDVVLFQYGQAIRRIAADRGFRDATATLEQLVGAADIEGYFLDQGLTPEAVMRRIRVSLTVDAILERTVTVTEDEVTANLERLRPVVEVPERRSFVVLEFATRAEADKLLPALKAADYSPDPKDVAVVGRPRAGASVGAVAAAVFALASPGDTAGPIEVQGKFHLAKLLQVTPGNLDIPNADKLTPEERAKELDARLRPLVSAALRDEKIASARAPWLLRLRKESKVDILWRPPTETPKP